MVHFDMAANDPRRLPRQVDGEDCLDHEVAHAGNAEEGFDYDGAGENASGLQAEDGHDG